ncbi:phosphatidylinositol-4- kinase [Thoreauomyces humboldtii]|nr:phosphatidylinositol-4- kinase [Thoreauomyces humboldtii]
MFYNLDDDFDAMALLCEAADLTAANPKVSQESALQSMLALSSPALSDYYYGRRTDKPHADGVAAYFRDPGLSGLLQYCLSSEGGCREEIVGLCLECGDARPALGRDDVHTFEDYKYVENHMFETGGRLLKVASRHGEYQEAIVDEVWGWVATFVDTVVENDVDTPAFRFAAASLTGILRAIRSTPLRVEAHEPHMIKLVALLATFLDHTETHPNPPRSSPAHSHDIVIGFFSTWQHLLLGSLEIRRAEAEDWVPGATEGQVPATWDNLTDGTRVSQMGLAETGTAVGVVYTMCWRVCRGNVAGIKNVGPIQIRRVQDTVAVAIKCALLCSYHAENLETDLLGKVSETLTSSNPLYGPDVYLAAVDCLKFISESMTEFQKRIIDILLDFLCNPPPNFVQWSADDEKAHSAVRHAAGSLLHQNLAGMEAYPLTIGVLNKCISVIRIGPSDVTTTKEIKAVAQTNCVVAMSLLAPLLATDEVLKSVFGAYEQALADPGFPNHDLVWQCLSDIGLTCGVDIFHSVIAIANKANNKKAIETRRKLTRGAAKSPAFAIPYLQKALVLFVETAVKFPRRTTASVAELFEIAWAVKTLCTSTAIGSDDPSVRAMEKPFQDFWFCCITNVLESSGAWPERWPKILGPIAEKTPALALSIQQGFLDDELTAHSVLKNTLPDEAQSRVRACLNHGLPGNATAVKALTVTKCVYLLSVRELERFRAVRLNSSVMLKYLCNDRLYNDDAYDFLHLIAVEVETTFLKQCARNREDNYPAIERHVGQLLFVAASRLERARRYASNALYRIHKIFPAFLWNRTVVNLMLDLLQCLDGNAVGSMERRELLRGKIGKSLDFLDDSDVSAASKDFFELCTKWMASATYSSSSETMGILQSYMVDLHTNFPELGLGEKSDLLLLLGRFCSSQEIASMIMRSVGKRAIYYGEVRGMLMGVTAGGRDSKASFARVARDLCKDLRNIINLPGDAVFPTKLHPVLHRAAAMVLLMDEVGAGADELLELICWTPITVFTPAVMDMAISVWNWLMSSRLDLAPRIMGHLVAVWETTAQEKKGLYHKARRSSNPFYAKMTYTPSKPVDKAAHSLDAQVIHLSWIRFLIERFKSARVQSEDHVRFYVKLYQIAHEHAGSICKGWYNREAYFLLLTLGSQIADHLNRNGDPSAYLVWSDVIEDALGWFAAPPMFGQVDQRELDILISFYTIIKNLRSGCTSPTFLDTPRARFARIAWFGAAPAGRVLLSDAQQLLLLLLENEIHRLAAWLNPLDDKKARVPDLPPNTERTGNWLATLRHAWSINPHVAIHLGSRFSNVEALGPALNALVHSSAASVIDLPEALPYVLVNADKQVLDPQLRYLLHWTAVPPITAVSLLGQQYKMHPWILQYAVRVLEHFPVEHVFFYIPQMVQALRYDTVGYIEHFILSAARTSQLFAHQIIWNMNANMYKFDKEGQADAPDSLKPTLERVQSKIIAGLSGSAKKFYEREFGFFSEVTGISGKLKPLVESGGSKAEKKAKIDEEMAKIEVEVGVYLPTNPEGIILDIDKKSGRPLQSHAKAPFMATFQVASVDEDADVGGHPSEDASSVDEDEDGKPDLAPKAPPVTKWMQSIFKVGDDCRQDVLALQLISIFKSIFSQAGLEVYLFPYRVVATAPGCGVIEVIPNSTSRDMMGREQVNNLYEWFQATFGKEDTVSFRKAQHEFIKSLAAYSVIMFLLQIKDRHNGNIMFDKSGHLVHIDFGFMLSIAPGGGLLEVAPFKLTHEMVQVLGGDTSTAQYRRFEELVVKCYLACRPHAEEIVQMVSLMMDSGLPCFKGDVTTRKLRDRFLSDKTERQAAEFMVSCVQHSHENKRTGLYDKFQYMQNGIPY